MKIKIFLVTLLFFQACFLFSQFRWSKVFYQDVDAYGNFIIESYDRGYLLLGQHDHSATEFNWLAKTDINGNFLWEKVIGSYSSLNILAHIDENAYGEKYLAGISTSFDEAGDPIIIKLNECCQKEWCVIYHTPDNMDYAIQILATSDGGCVSALMYTGEKPHNKDRICLIKIDSEGTVTWKKYYNGPDTLIVNQECDHLFETPDHGYLITGICQYTNPDPPHIQYNKPYFLKVDSSGDYQWETVPYSEMGAFERGHGWTTTIDPSGSYYYSSISHYKYYPYSSSPAILKMDLNGNVVDVYDLVNGYVYGGLGWSQFINDTVMAGVAGWCNDLDLAKQYAVLFDTTGIIADCTLLTEDIYSPYFQSVFDQKFVYMFNTYQNNQFDVHLTKLDRYLEDDTFYTYPFLYDSLCAGQIQSDTIELNDCDLIVGVTEDWEIEHNTTIEIIEIYPNPTSNDVNIRYSLFDTRYSLFIYDMFGRLMDEIIVPPGQEESRVDVSDYPEGIYIAVLRNDAGIVGRRKFVVVH